MRSKNTYLVDNIVKYRGVVSCAFAITHIRRIELRSVWIKLQITLAPT